MTGYASAARSNQDDVYAAGRCQREQPVPTNVNYVNAFLAIQSGDLETLQNLLAAHPDLATFRLGGIAGGRTPLHVVTDWPGYSPNGPRIAQMLIDAGADL